MMHVGVSVIFSFISNENHMRFVSYLLDSNIAQRSIFDLERFTETSQSVQNIYVRLVDRAEFRKVNRAFRLVCFLASKTGRVHLISKSSSNFAVIWFEFDPVQ